MGIGKWAFVTGTVSLALLIVLAGSTAAVWVLNKQQAETARVVAERKQQDQLRYRACSDAYESRLTSAKGITGLETHRSSTTQSLKDKWDEADRYVYAFCQPW